MTIDVTYMSGAGNIFTVIDNRSYNLSIDELSKFSPMLCGVNSNHFKTEGLLALEKGDNDKDFLIQFINPDGSFGPMCGNGGRCAVLFAKNLGLIKNINNINFFMAGSDYKGNINDDKIKLYFPKPDKIIEELEIFSDNKKYSMGYIDVNSDHIVFNFDNLNELRSFDDFDLERFALKFRYHNNFQPKGVNVNVFKIIDKNTIKLRTFERGVEAETGACGTGAISSAIIASINNKLDFPIKVIPTSKIPVYVYIIGNIQNIETVILEGPAEIIGNTKIEV